MLPIYLEEHSAYSYGGRRFNQNSNNLQQLLPLALGGDISLLSPLSSGKDKRSSFLYTFMAWVQANLVNLNTQFHQCPIIQNKHISNGVH
jgi:hypothetical protein